MTDVYEHALTAPAGTPLLIERADGHASTADLDWWLRRPGARPPADLPAIDWAASPGTAIDVGCATGRHLEHLAERGITAYGIDTSPAAIRLARDQGLDARHADARDHTPDAPVDTVLLLGGGLGIAGTRHNTSPFLARIAQWIIPGGQIITSSVDWTATASTEPHRAWVNKARDQGRYPGDVTLRLRHGAHAGEPFAWTWIDPGTLTSLAAAAWLQITTLERYGPAWYAAALTQTRPAP